MWGPDERGPMSLKRIRSTFVIAAVLAALMCVGFGASLALANPDGDNIPGTPVASLPFTTTGSLDASGTDVRDVYAVHLNAGDTIEATLTADAGTDFDIFLYSPSTTVINDSTYSWAASNKDATSTEDFKYMAPISGTYYFDVWAYRGAGAYTATITKIATQPFKLGAITAPKSAKKGKSVTVSVPITPAYNSYPYTPITFDFYRWENHKWKHKAYKAGISWKTLGTTKNIVSASYKFPKKGSWRIKATFWDPAHKHVPPVYRKITIK